MRGKWIDCLFAEHSIDFLKLNNINTKNLPLRYYFSSSYELVRPLWTYFLKIQNVYILIMLHQFLDFFIMEEEITIFITDYYIGMRNYIGQNILSIIY